MTEKVSYAAGIHYENNHERKTKMSRQTWKGGSLLAPLPAVLVTCKGTDRDSRQAENVFTVAWTGIINTIPPKTYISVRKSRYSYDIIKSSGKFVINIPTAAIAKKWTTAASTRAARLISFKNAVLRKSRHHRWMSRSSPNVRYASNAELRISKSSEHTICS